MKNDPLYLDHFLVVGLSCLTEQKRDRRLTVTLTSYPEIVGQAYDRLVANDKAFRKRVSAGMFAYWCNMLLWRRLLEIAGPVSGSLTPEFVRLAEVWPSPTVIPKEVSVYLSGLGRSIDKDNRGWRTVTRVTPNEHGHFGRVSADTVWDYAELPAPLLSLERLRYEIDTAHEQVINWPIPAPLAPAGGGMTSTPTDNLLGYVPARGAPPEIKETFTDLGLRDENGFRRNAFSYVSGLPLHQPLLARITDHFDASPAALKAGWPSQVEGSVVQHAYVQLSTDQEEIAGPRPSAHAEVRAVSSSQMGPSHVGALHVCRYRREVPPDLNPFWTFPFRLADDITEDQRAALFAHANRSLHAGDNNLLTTRQFAGPYQPGFHLIHDWIIGVAGKTVRG